LHHWRSLSRISLRFIRATEISPVWLTPPLPPPRGA
jgi:hypothetical protein